MLLKFALDCTNGNFTAALLENAHVVEHINEYPFKEAAEYCAVWLDEALKKHNLSANQIGSFISVAGPGGFSGVRTGTSMISGMSSVLSVPVKTLSSLEALALSFNNVEDQIILSCLNAKRNGVYLGLYRVSDSILEHILPEQLVQKNDLEDFYQQNLSNYNQLSLAGHGLEIIKPFLGDITICQEIVTSDAARFGSRSDFIHSNRPHEPIYLRAADAALPKKKFEVPKVSGIS